MSKKLNFKAEQKLDEAFFYLEEGNPMLAKEIAIKLEKKYPKSIDVLYLKQAIGAALDDSLSVLRCSFEIYKIRPNDLINRFNLMMTYLKNSYHSLVLDEYEYLNNVKLPIEIEDDFRNFSKQIVPEIQKIVAKFSVKYGGNQVAAYKHDLIRLNLTINCFEEAQRLAENTVKEFPNFIPAYNNLSEIYFQQAQIEKSLEIAEKAVKADPFDAFAQASKTRCKLFLAKEIDFPKSLEKRVEHNFFKQVEALLYIEKYDLIVSLYKELDKNLDIGNVQEEASALKAIAFSYFMLRDEKNANKIWSKVVELDSRNSNNIVENKFYFFELYTLLPLKIYEKIFDGKTKSEKATTKKIHALYTKYPFIIELAKIGLRFGDESCIHFAQMIAIEIDNESLYVEMSKFVSGRRLSDNVRKEVALFLQSRGWLEEGYKFFINGEERKLKGIQQEIITGPLREFDPRTGDLEDEIAYLMTDGNYKKAEKLIRKALEIVPDKPSLLNNLAVIYATKGEEKKAEELVREIHAKHPDYLFACIAIASIEIEKNNIQAAKELLFPLATRERLHITELKAIHKTQLKIAFAEGEYDSVREILSVWEELYGSKHPDHEKYIKKELTKNC